jgi:hypothetical protein
MHTAMVIGGAALSLLASALGGSPAPTQAEPAPPDKVFIEVVKVNGSGCRGGTAVADIAPDRTAFTVTYSEYLVQVGTGSKPKDAQRDCQLTVRLDIPPGFSYAIARADYRGFARLEPGATGLQRARYRFQTQRPTPYVDHPFRGPLDDNWQRTDTTDSGDLSWGPCGKSRKLDIETELRVNAGTSAPDQTSVLAMDSTDGSIDTTYRFAWRHCNR